MASKSESTSSKAKSNRSVHELIERLEHWEVEHSLLDLMQEAAQALRELQGDLQELKLRLEVGDE